MSIPKRAMSLVSWELLTDFLNYVILDKNLQDIFFVKTSLSNLLIHTLRIILFYFDKEALLILTLNSEKFVKISRFDLVIFNWLIYEDQYKYAGYTDGITSLIFADFNT